MAACLLVLYAPKTLCFVCFILWQRVMEWHLNQMFSLSAAGLPSNVLLSFMSSSSEETTSSRKSISLWSSEKKHLCDTSFLMWLHASLYMIETPYRGLS